jgi:hypothetical protein
MFSRKTIAFDRTSNESTSCLYQTWDSTHPWCIPLASIQGLRPFGNASFGVT